MKRIGIFGGTFNPVHAGHVGLAQWLASHGGFDEVWLTLSPMNPLKDAEHPGATDTQRTEMLALACQGHPQLKPCLVELELPRPSYSITTLRYLAANNSDCSFEMLVGSDNWLNFSRWREPQAIISEFGVTVYPRPGYPTEDMDAPAGVTMLKDAPQTDISSTRLRQLLAEGDVLAFEYLPRPVGEYIKENHLYSYPK